MALDEFAMPLRPGVICGRGAWFTKGRVFSSIIFWAIPHVRGTKCATLETLEMTCSTVRHFALATVIEGLVAVGTNTVARDGLRQASRQQAEK